jgi:hypothetical protein
MYKLPFQLDFTHETLLEYQDSDDHILTEEEIKDSFNLLSSLPPNEFFYFLSSLLNQNNFQPVLLSDLNFFWNPFEEFILFLLELAIKFQDLVPRFFDKNLVRHLDSCFDKLQVNSLLFDLFFFILPNLENEKSTVLVIRRIFSFTNEEIFLRNLDLVFPKCDEGTQRIFLHSSIVSLVLKSVFDDELRSFSFSLLRHFAGLGKDVRKFLISSPILNFKFDFHMWKDIDAIYFEYMIREISEDFPGEVLRSKAFQEFVDSVRNFTVKAQLEILEIASKIFLSPDFLQKPLPESFLSEILKLVSYFFLDLVPECIIIVSMMILYSEIYGKKDFPLLDAAIFVLESDFQLDSLSKKAEIQYYLIEGFVSENEQWC